MLKNTLIIALVIVIIYLYYQQKKQSNFLTGTTTSDSSELTSFLKDNLNSNNLEELKSKLGTKSLNELLEENEDYETEVDTLTRTKNSLEQDLTAQAEAFQARQREKDRELKKLKEDLKALETVRGQLTSEKQQHKGSLERIKLLTEQITKLEKEDKSDLIKSHQEQLRKINSLFDDNAINYPQIDFNGLYSLLETIAQESKKKKKTIEPIYQLSKEAKQINYSLTDFQN
jgi:chromosome segregation ATPase